jgi:serine/threonine-protein kinase
MRFQCSKCLSIIEADTAAGKHSCPCPKCRRITPVPRTPLENYAVFANFIIRETIGDGEIGTVFRAEQIDTKHEIALKIFSPDFITRKTIKIFLRDTRAVAGLDHANVVKTLAFGATSDGICYTAMNLIRGETIQEKLRQGRKFTVAESLEIARQIGEAILYAWRKAKLIHRDLKPENIMITNDGIIKLTDWGLAVKAANSIGLEDLAGTPAYMSPEQFSCEPLDWRSDVYSLGVTLYQLISGKLPFSGRTFQQIASQHFNQCPKPLFKLAPGIPAGVSELVERMLSKLPNDRFKSPAQLIQTIQKIQNSV